MSYKSLILAAALFLSVPTAALASPVIGYTGAPRPTRKIRPCEYIGDATVTVYNPTPEQTDGSPFITADGTDIRDLGPWETSCAISEDFLSRSGGEVSFGDRITVVHGIDGLSKSCIVHDAMAPEVYKKDIDAWVPLTKYVDILVKDDVMGRWFDAPVMLCKERTA